MAAVVKDFDYFGIRHYISKQLFSKLKGLNITINIHPVNINKKGIGLIIKLNHLNIAIFPEPTLQINPNNLTLINSLSTLEQTLNIINIKTFLRF